MNNTNKSIETNKSKSKSNESIGSIKSTVKSSYPSKSKKISVSESDLTIGQLEMMANKKKINKKKESLSSLNTQDTQDTRDTRDKSSPKIQSPNLVIQEKCSSSSSSSTDSEYERQKKEKIIQKENKDEKTRNEKCRLLYNFSKLNTNERYSVLKLDMNFSLDEIKNEIDRIVNAKNTESSVAFLKKILLVSVQGIELANRKFDPFGLDLDGWGDSMNYELDNFDNVLAELAVKYFKGSSNYPPEIKLIGLILFSGFTFTFMKKMDPNKILNGSGGSGLLNILNTFIRPQQQMPQQQMPQQQMPQQQMPQQQMPQQQMPQQQMQEQYQRQMQEQYQRQMQEQYQRQMQEQYQQQLQQQQQQVRIPQANELSSDDDSSPPKIRDPNQESEINIEDILKTMRKTKKEKEILNDTENQKQGRKPKAKKQIN